MSDHPHTPRRVVVGQTTWQYDEQNGWFNDADDPAMLTEVEMLEQIERLSAMVAAVDALHVRDDESGAWCIGCDAGPWPCPTHLAIHPEENR